MTSTAPSSAAPARAGATASRRAVEQRTLSEALALARLAVAVARAATTREAADALLEAMDEAVPEADVALCLLDDHAGEFELIGVRTTDARSVDVRQRWPQALPTPARDAVIGGIPMSFDPETYARRYPEVVRIAGQGFARYLALPIVAGRRAVGALGLSWAIEPGLDERAIAHLQELADTGGLALGRAGQEEEARRTRDLMTAMVGQMPLGVVILEPGPLADRTRLRTRYMNDAFREIFGIDGEGDGGPGLPGSPAASEPADGRPHLRRMDGQPATEAERPLFRATLRGEVIRDERFLLEHPDGTRRLVSVNAGPVRGPDGRVLAGVGVYADVTDRLEAEDAREAFLGVLSHELRTPVTAIYGGAEVLRRRLGHDPELAGLAVDLAEEASRLHRLVENLLVLSRVERGADLRRDDPVLVRHVVRRVVAIESPRWPGRRFEIETDSDSAPVLADEGYIELIATNLLSNAAKYGPADGVVRIRVWREGREVRLAVADDGPGFDPGSEARAFELFFRGPDAQRRAPGAGIGLFAVKALAEAVGGRAEAHNRPEGGAEVTVAFPVLDPDAGVPDLTSPPRSH